MYKDKSIIIESRKTSSIGKPSALVHDGNARLSKKQKDILNVLYKENMSADFVKRDGFDVHMKDLSCLTYETKNEFALFKRNDKCVIYRGERGSIVIPLQEMKELKRNKYKWVGHTHVGYDAYCLYPSEADKKILKQLDQKQSTIFNMSGESITFDIDGVL